MPPNQRTDVDMLVMPSILNHPHATHTTRLECYTIRQFECFVQIKQLENLEDCLCTEDCLYEFWILMSIVSAWTASPYWSDDTYMKQIVKCRLWLILYMHCSCFLKSTLGCADSIRLAGAPMPPKCCLKLAYFLWRTTHGWVGMLLSDRRLRGSFCNILRIKSWASLLMPGGKTRSTREIRR